MNPLTRAVEKLRLRAQVLAIGVAGLALPGCSFLSNMSVETQLFRQHVVACTEAINRGDLAQAEVHLASARPVANSAQQRQQLHSLETLITGAEALMQGDARLAEAHWSTIEDPYLRREVRMSAQRLDLDVPVAPRKGGVQ